MRSFLIYTVLVSLSASSIAQTISKPFFATLSNHPITIEEVKNNPQNTTISLSIENQIENGNFCVDKNTYIIDLESGKKYKLIKVSGLPNCPSTYNFSYVGEKLNFQLVFQKIDTKTQYINLIENCNQHCFFLKGVILNNNFNEALSSAYKLYAKSNFEVASQNFEDIIKKHPNYQFGFVHYSLVKIYAEKYDFESAKSWLSILKEGKFHDKDELISKLQKEKFYHKIK